MIQNRLYFNTALKALEDKNNFLVWWYPWGGMVRNKDGEEIGDISTKIMDKLLESGKLETYGVGTDLLDHERYFRLKPLSSQ